MPRLVSVMWVTKLLIFPVEIRIYCFKTAKFGPKSAFLVNLGQILPFFAHFVQCSTKNQCEQGAQVGFPLSSPRAESARAFTGRRNSYSGRGEDFLSRQPNFFTETAVTPERKVEKWFPKWEINRHAEG